ncbi:MAG: methionyl-tRNA formyltransferase [Alphaproteobacteria bacterium]|nr:methionyl-tRNA formyltransferase [Alphaproteobacteria bacterium]
MRIAFMGTPDFSVPAYDALRAAGHEIACVYTQPPRPAGRGQKERPSPVHARADADGIEVRTPRTLKDEDAQAAFRALGLDAAVVVAYGLILPKPILDAPRRGCINIHASLLPRWRGAAPIHRALLAGDAETGVTIMQIDEGLDTGPELLREAVPIGPDTTTGDLHDTLAELGGRLIVAGLAGLEDGSIVPVPQPDEGATYAAKIERGEERIDWAQPVEVVERHIRGFAPWPGAWSELDGERVKVLAAEIADGAGTPGTVLDDRLTVACGSGALRLIRVQRAGKSVMDADAFLRGSPVGKGAHFA